MNFNEICILCSSLTTFLPCGIRMRKKTLHVDHVIRVSSWLLTIFMVHFVKNVTQWCHSSAENKAQKKPNQRPNWCSKRYMCEAPGSIGHLWAYIPSSFARSLLVCGKVVPPNQVGKSFWMTESFCKTHTVGCLYYYSARRQGMFSIVFIIVSVYALLHSGCALW